MSVKLKLNDLLNLSEDEIAKSKMGLNMTLGQRGETCLNDWLKTGNVDFSYHNTAKVAHHKVGNWVFGFVQFTSKNRWLLVTTGEVTEIPPKGVNGSCKFKKISDRFEGLEGRLVIEIEGKKGDMGRYSYNLSHYLNNAVVIEILPDVYSGPEFTNFYDIHLTFGELADIIDGKRSKSIRDALNSVYGVYVLTSDDGHIYIGSAYGENGLAQRWSEYLKTEHGNNKALKALYEKDNAYFREHFYFSIIETFSKHSDVQKVLDAEYHLISILKSRQGLGLNRNGRK